eukprot:CAMPEP_0115874358 /NCGR_PEP_ID=MMETSP0287-20121206/24498_1 /TAXON_ID=412157 /ORGANISM="Chrysochromulina rotalis, Strain UIO044" /LENGTH=43 /DNA_ID= /DNA_START= /DNA_END= /DNA_ORIENTATION=
MKSCEDGGATSGLGGSCAALALAPCRNTMQLTSQGLMRTQSAL